MIARTAEARNAEGARAGSAPRQALLRGQKQAAWQRAVDELDLRRPLAGFLFRFSGGGLGQGFAAVDRAPGKSRMTARTLWRNWRVRTICPSSVMAAHGMPSLGPWRWNPVRRRLLCSSVSPTMRR
jgi:hypothetical protein